MTDGPATSGAASDSPASGAAAKAGASASALGGMGDSEAAQTWFSADIEALFDLPFSDLIFRAQQVHREHFDPNRVEQARLLSIKTGGCPEDCGYCAQSAHFDTGVKAEKLMAVDAVVESARQAKRDGATRFCMGAAWREPKERDMPALCDMIREVRALGLETCMTLGMLTDGQAAELAGAGLDFYNHNLDTSPEFYGEIISTRTYADRLDTLARVRDAGIAVCCGGIVGMGERVADRAGMLHALAGLDPQPESVPVNALIPAAGTPLAGAAPVDTFDLVRTIAVARIVLPRAVVRLSAGREAMSDEAQALCFLAGANSIFTGDRLLTASNPGQDDDAVLFERLGLVAAEVTAS